MMNGYGIGGFFGMGLWWIVIVVLVVAAVAFAFRRGGDSDGKSAPPESARDVLDKRYARGEIGRDEYEQKKRDLAA